MRRNLLICGMLIFGSCSPEIEYPINQQVKARGIYTQAGDISPLYQDLFPDLLLDNLNPGETYDFHVDEKFNEIEIVKASIKGGNFSDHQSAFQITYYESLSGKADKIYLNNFEEKTLLTVENPNWLFPKTPFILQTSHGYYEIEASNSKWESFLVKEIPAQTPDILFLDRFPEFELISISEQISRPSDLYQSKPFTYIYYLSHTCRTCIKEIPKINQALEQYENLKVIGILPGSETAELWSALNEKTNWGNYKIRSSNNYQKFPSISLPDGFLINQQGQKILDHITLEDVLDYLN
ncbi:hypothetical protein KI659_06925 [Litoribacter alkaliphilus]|uniref:Thioredoxin domain-containing protein n=1 Tax=Litoribacter ruber TaxID=702568 RepID=A0AAP2CH93_9BACT|nr:hypothetical protein [Litoribacter alkaliphilus]MBS9523750.1 hypothetical protein [Litoribacter alkaliphilus]